ncbi:non-canonical purine NTP pyrophosphatase [Bifidobacterium sp. ESL0769]|uniref:non-canonical purine NTP pyrophosphatase n=1 Tax=Bifidobacterium sp. ESL0769 TaxID=2983229 RepID=UPI0023F9D5AE|nr:non-canonical purine NTP pyrophosphatase [Bifidobacterium sp. ESL0769]WEV67145.1 non-canonical purine NTP pyrophosphatase [Bifidobacterium sp. ESL0769]
MKIVVATHNEGKLPEIRKIIETELGEAARHVELVSAGSMNLPDPVEDGVTFEENALIKARDVAKRTGLPALADDSGLIVDVLGAAPGILSARWAGAHGHDKANNALLLAQLEDIPDGKRGARFNCAAALVVPKHCGEERSNGTTPKAEETVKLGEMRGTVIREPRGENGFGYDSIFVPNDQPGRLNDDGEKLTSAEMTAEEKNSISHRHKAFVALAPAIKALIG